MLRYVSLSFKLFIKTHVDSFFVGSKKCDRPKSTRNVNIRYSESDHSILSICIEVSFTSLHLVSQHDKSAKTVKRCSN